MLIFLKNESKKPYFRKLYSNLKKEYQYCKNNNIAIYPPIDLVFNVFKLCPLQNINVVVLGQDPYINKVVIKENNQFVTKIQAMGLSFSVPIGVYPPPSLKNIYKELSADPNINFTVPDHGDLTNWVKEGVFLLNCALTVREKNSNTHAKYWQEFTENVIKYISNNCDNVVFMLWGRFAKSKEKLIDINKHLIIKTSHPSPLSARYGFSGSCCFSECNKLLEKNHKKPINWSL